MNVMQDKWRFNVTVIAFTENIVFVNNLLQKLFTFMHLKNLSFDLCCLCFCIQLHNEQA